uniref:Metalloendopeptidase n=1 Tax=Megaselia scalaris TaxID=36166 RepID=T1GJD9_MEGSC
MRGGGTGFKEDDMILTRSQKIALYSNLEGRNVYKSASTRWPSKTVFYKYSSTITSAQKSLIEKAFKSIESVTCVKIRPAGSSTENYVYVTNENSGCWSYVGFLGGRQQLNLQSNGCMYFGIITHETLHTLGFFHQQSASDRDRFINIHYDNISPGREYNFAKYSRI